jgi:hypothetical protein
MDEIITFYITIEVCAALEVCVKTNFFDLMCQEGPITLA